MDRTILHCDCNSYFASVELLTRPELRDRPVAVCGDPAARHGVILAKNELAKRCGVKTAETIASARRKCPGAGAAQAASRAVFGILPAHKCDIRAVHRPG